MHRCCSRPTSDLASAHNAGLDRAQPDVTDRRPYLDLPNERSRTIAEITTSSLDQTPFDTDWWAASRGSHSLKQAVMSILGPLSFDTFLTRAVKGASAIANIKALLHITRACS